MLRNKVQRKSTWIDMTPFVDVAFLILAFFIMATKFKPDEAVKVETPSSVSSKPLEERDNTFIMLLDKKGDTYVQLSENLRKPMIEYMNDQRKLGMSASDIKAFIKSGAVSSSLADLKNSYSKSANKANIKKGVPLDSIGGELKTWVEYVHSKTAGKAQWYIKGDNAVKYPQFRNVLKALKDNGIFKFNLVTSTEPVPSGSALDIANQKKQ